LKEVKRSQKLKDTGRKEEKEDEEAKTRTTMTRK
jgi:hypothetical protein